MSRFDRVILREISLPLAEPFRTAKGIVNDRRIILLEIFDADRMSVWSECVAGAAPDYTTETVESAWDILSVSIIPASVGREFSHPREIHAQLAAAQDDHPMARAAVEMGAWALASMRKNKSLASLLAESCAEPSDPRSSVETGIVIGVTGDSDALEMRVRDAIATGYRRVKLKISPASDIQSIRRVSDIAGNATAVDANGSFSIENPEHLRMLREIDALGMSMIEQPLPADAMTEHAELQRLLMTPICLDESISSVDSVEAMIGMKSALIANLKPGRVGGFTESIAIHDRCARAGIPVWCGGMLETGIGRAYNVALASLPNFRLPGDLSPSSRYWRRDIVTPPWTMSADGTLQVPVDRVGTGVKVDPEFVDGLTVRSLEISA